MASYLKSDIQRTKRKKGQRLLFLLFTLTQPMILRSKICLIPRISPHFVLTNNLFYCTSQRFSIAHTDSMAPLNTYLPCLRSGSYSYVSSSLRDSSSLYTAARV